MKIPELSFRSPKTEVRDSKIQGKGLFAKENIKAGEIVCAKGGYIFPDEKWIDIERTLGPAQIQISEKLF